MAGGSREEVPEGGARHKGYHGPGEESKEIAFLSGGQAGGHEHHHLVQDDGRDQRQPTHQGDLHGNADHLGCLGEDELVVSERLETLRRAHQHVEDHSVEDESHHGAHNEGRYGHDGACAAAL